MQKLKIKTSAISNYNKIIIKITQSTYKNIQFFYYNNDQHKYYSLLEILEKNQVKINYQCRIGYCGICKVILLKGQIKYYQEPLASCINNNEIFPCCCIPIKNITLRI